MVNCKHKGISNEDFFGLVEELNTFGENTEINVIATQVFQGNGCWKAVIYYKKKGEY